MDEKQVPDNVAQNPHSLPYASDLGAPVIKPDHSLGGWKVGQFIEQISITMNDSTN